MKVHVDADVCAGHGICLGLAPTVFELEDDGYAIVLVSEVPDDHVEDVRRAVQQCPTGAITTSE